MRPDDHIVQPTTLEQAANAVAHVRNIVRGTDKDIVRAVLLSVRNPASHILEVGTAARWRSPIRNPDNVGEIFGAMIDAIIAENATS